jgi:hypothetical protein
MRNRNCSDLLENDETVVAGPPFDNLAVRNAEDAGSAQGHRATSRGVAHQRSLVRALGRPPSCDAIGLRDLIFDCKAQVREGDQSGL